MLLAEIDPSTYLSRLNESKANLMKGRVNLRQASRSLERGKKLYEEKFLSDSELEDLEFAVESSEATLEQFKANFETAKTNLENCKIYSPINGVVISRNVDVGQTVAASFQAPTLFILAEDLAKMQIEVNVDEADIGRIKERQKVKFDVDAYSEKVFRGIIVQIRLQPEIISNVVTYITIVEVDNSENFLKPGMTANVSIIEAERDSALKLPMTALRFSMPEEVRQAMQTDIGTEENEKKADEEEKQQVRAGAGNAPAHPPGGMMPGGNMNAMRERFHSMSPEQRTKMMKRFAKKNKKQGVQTRKIWVLREDESVEQIQVFLGISDGDYIEVVRGNLKEGDAVITSVLQDGMPVSDKAGGGFSYRDVRRTTRRMGR
jgi:HlyD family secretion protein